ncbi:MAG: metal-dependent hydrolase [Bacteroidales bacterium]|jgi:inner membrane protein|nr:metal-dependent hydrolase [Bacteroidales bacterium]MDY0198029.1 metal-dependent hydrolase [Tenuifilaceae bacterium]
MDSLTHIIIGAATGQVMLGKKEGNKALLWGAVAANIPDFDAAFTSLFNPASAVLMHRGFSHSILFALIITPLLGFLIAKILKSKNTWQWIGLTLVAILTHSAIDCLNTYGTGIFEPFTNLRVAYDTMPIVDMLLLIPILITMALALFYSYKSKARNILSIAVLAFSFAYFGYSILIKEIVNKRVVSQLNQKNIPYNRFITAPLPLTNFIWLTVAEDNDGFHYAYQSILEKDSPNYKYIKKNHELLGDYSNSKAIKQLQRFTKGYYVVEHKNGAVYLNDLRFAGLDLRNNDWFVFSFEITGDYADPNISRSHPNRKITKENLIAYWESLKTERKPLNELF